MNTVLVVAPHPDDETLGCGGTLLRHAALGDEVHWLIVTDMAVALGYPADVVERRQAEIRAVSDAFGFAGVHNLKLPPVRVDAMPMHELVALIGAVVGRVAPREIYVPFRHDVHTDHAAVFDAVASCAKWFRYPSVQRVAAYETLSETGFGLGADSTFAPNCFVDITPHVQRKIEIAHLYRSEMAPFPFPRSAEAIEALARLRGSSCGCAAAEAFMVVREIVK